MSVFFLCGALSSSSLTFLHVSVFVFHEAMVKQEPPYDPHLYWKMRVTSMHRNPKTKERWIVGAWFYTPSQLKEIKLRKRYEFLTSDMVSQGY